MDGGFWDAPAQAQPAEQPKPTITPDATDTAPNLVYVPVTQPAPPPQTVFVYAAVWIVNISNHADPVVETWAPGMRQPTHTRDVVSVAGITVPLDAVFDGLDEIPVEEE